MSDNLLGIDDIRLLFDIRHTEEELLRVFDDGKLRGTTHTYIGQEAIAVSVAKFIDDTDIVVSNHRCHGHYLAYGGDIEKLFYEIKGSKYGTCKGMGGSQHLFENNFYTNGIQGGMVPVSLGMALAEKRKKQNGIVVNFIGDGTLGQGVVYESLNIASLLDIPILFVVENNQYAQSTSIELNMSGSIIERFKAFGVNSSEIQSNDISQLVTAFDNAFEYVRTCSKPFCQIVHTYRFGPHSKGDDNRDLEEIKKWKKYDPIKLAEKNFEQDDFDMIRDESKNKISILSEKIFYSDPDGEAFIPENDSQIIGNHNFKYNNINILNSSSENFVKHLNNVLDELMFSNDKVILIGEDIHDPYGGAFKVTKGLHNKYADRIITTPISEAAIVGMANGLALRGYKPVVEIMFGDFTTLIVDQIVNHATKFNSMYAGQTHCPIIVRTPMGGYRGYGPTHSQSLEKMFLGVPGLTIVAANLYIDQKYIWNRMMEINYPVLYIENKSLYGKYTKNIDNGLVEGFSTIYDDGLFPNIIMQLGSVENNNPDIVCYTYGAMSELALNVAKKLFIEHEILVRIVIVTQLSPYPVENLFKALGVCNNAIILEEGTIRNGWGAELATSLNETAKDKLNISRCAAENTVIPSSGPGETSVLPSENKLYKLIMDNLDGF